MVVVFGTLKQGQSMSIKRTLMKVTTGTNHTILHSTAIETSQYVGMRSHSDIRDEQRRLQSRAPVSYSLADDTTVEYT